MRQLVKGVGELAQTLITVLFITSLLLLVVETIWEGTVALSLDLTYLVIATIVFGSIALWLNRDKIDLKAEAKREELGETERKAEFGEKFPGIDRIPVVRWFARWMYKEGWLYSVVLILLLLIGFYLRIYSLGTQPFWVDEVTSAVAASSIFTYGIPTLPSGLIYDAALLDQYIRAASFGILGINNFSARLPTVIFGAITIPITYVLGKRLGGRKAGIIAALLVTFCTMEIAWARQARTYQQLQFFYVLSLYLFLRVTETKRVRYLIFLPLSLVAALMSHILAGVLFVVFGLYIIIFEHGRLALIFSYVKEHPVKASLIVVAIICPILLGVLAYDIRAGFGLITLHFVNNQSLFLTYLKDISPWVFLLFWIGLIGLLRHREGFLLVLAVATPWLLLFYQFENVWYRYIYFTLPLFFIAAASALVRSTTWASNAAKLPPWAPSRVIYAVSTVFLLFLIIGVLPLHQADADRQPSFSFTPQVNYDLPRVPQTNFEKAYGYILGSLEESDVVISVTTGLAPAYYYLGEHFSNETNYCLSYKFPELAWAYLAYNEDGLWYEGYTASRVITGYGEFIELVHGNPRGWVVIDHQKIYHLDDDTYDYTYKNMRYYEVASDETVKVYSWEHE